MSTILVTGATGGLGRELVQQLVEREQKVRIFAHRAQPQASNKVEVYQGDIRTGEGLTEAVAGVDTIIHCVSVFEEGYVTDLEGTRHLIEAARQAGVGHLAYISIVGIEHMPFSYFQAKLQVEHLIEQSGLPYTILRATQFHTWILNTITSMQDAATGTISIPAGSSFQPIDTSEVAAALVSVALQPAAGHVPDIGGPQVLTLEELVDTYQRVRNQHYPVQIHNYPGEYFETFRYPEKLVPERAVGRITWQDFLKQRA